MSRSHPHSSNQSRPSRQPQTPNLAVTEASFQSLHLSDTSLPSSYGTSNQYSSRGTFGQGNLSTNYLTPGYQAASYASNSPSGSYTGSQRGVSPFAPLEQASSGFFDTDPSNYSKTDMRSVPNSHHLQSLLTSSSSYSYQRAPLPSSYDGHGAYGSSRSPSMHGNSGRPLLVIASITEGRYRLCICWRRCFLTSKYVISLWPSHPPKFDLGCFQHGGSRGCAATTAAIIRVPPSSQSTGATGQTADHFRTTGGRGRKHGAFD